LDEAEVRQVARALKAQGVESIALCFLHSYANPAHEERAAAILAQEFPQAAVSVSSRIVREWREYERTSTTAINAFIMPVVGRYLSMLQEHLAERRYRHPLFVNQSSGGIIPADTARHQPVRTIMSGPAGGAVCTAYIGQAAGFPDVIGFDMGGTSTDVSLTHAGRTRVTVEAKIEGHPILVPMIDIHSIGAGGGSLARVDAVGTLLVGPQSAGADPGPVCYGRGGTQPTVTDANLVLGRIDPTYFLGGAMALDEASAKRALEEQVAKPLGLPLVQAAEGMIRVVNTKMAYAIRALTVQKGLDPKDFVLLAFGGAGPMHACALAAELDIPRVLVPIVPGAFSALGMLLTDFRHDFARTCLAPASQVDLSQVHSLYEDMVQEATAALLADGVARSAISTERALDMRYTGQEYTVTVLVPNGKFSQRTLAVVRQAFDSAHQRTYGHSSPEQPVEIVSLRLWGRGAVPPLTLPTLPEGKRTPPPEAVRHQGQVYFAEAGGFVTCSFYERGKLLAGNRLEGPAIITDRGATTVLPPGFSLKVSEHGNMLLERR
ncbi:MAG: hydantoinase/oxoprolinase family protein, partial [Deinococcus sp.]|nr:hydantoinase/oxoprolinase family protein [Deinococcus sp.]